MCPFCYRRIPRVLTYCRMREAFTRTRAHELLSYAAALIAFLLIDLFFRVFNFYGS